MIPRLFDTTKNMLTDIFLYILTNICLGYRKSLSKR